MRVHGERLASAGAQPATLKLRPAYEAARFSLW